MSVFSLVNLFRQPDGGHSPGRSHCLQAKFEDTKGLFKIRKSKDRQSNGQKKKGQNDVQNTTQEDRAKRFTLKPGVNSGAPEG